MSWEAQRTRIAGRIWKSITQSGVDLAPIPREQQEILVTTITEGMLVELNDLLDDVASTPNSAIAPDVPGAGKAPGAEEETILWEGRPFLSLIERYVITDQRVRIITGIVGRSHEDIELIRIKDVDHTQGVGERILNVGDVILHSADASRPAAFLRNVTNPEEVHEIVRRAMLNSRKRYPFVFEQEM